MPVKIASMMDACLGSSAMRHRWRQSDHGFDLRQARQVRSPPPIPLRNLPSRIAWPEFASRIVADEQMPPRRFRADSRGRLRQRARQLFPNYGAAYLMSHQTAKAVVVIIVEIKNESPISLNHSE
jgi:hypothetical protein